jgi:hypothetical protein
MLSSNYATFILATEMEVKYILQSSKKQIVIFFQVV